MITTANRGDQASGERSVDRDGSINLIDAAAKAGVARFVLVPAQSADPNSPADIFRGKWQAEQYLRSSGLEHTIIRPIHLVDSWIQLIGPSASSGKVTLFGKADNPISFARWQMWHGSWSLLFEMRVLPTRLSKLEAIARPACMRSFPILSSTPEIRRRYMPL